MTGFANSDIASDKLLSNSTPTHRLQHNALNAAVRQQFTLAYDAREYGALPNSGSDETAHLQAAIDAADTAGGGIVRLLAGTYLLNDVVTISASGVILEGAGPVSTILKRNGTDTSPVVKIGTTDGADDKIQGAGIRRLQIDGNTHTQYGLRLTTIDFADVSQLQLKRSTSWQILMDCLDTRPVGGDPRSNQHCALRDLDLICTGSQGGLRLTGNSNAVVDAGNGANTSLNRFDNISVAIVDGTAFQYADCDGNISSHLRVYCTGSGTGLDLLGYSGSGNGHCRENQFFGVQLGNSSGCTAHNTSPHPSTANFIFGYSTGNSSPDPVIQSGAGLKWIDTTGGGNWP